MIDILKNALRNITRKKLRAALTMCGISIGVLSVVIISTIGNIGKYAINSELESIGMSGLLVSVDSTVGGVKMFTEELEEINNDPDVQNAAPLMVTYTNIQILNNTIPCLTWGINDDAKNLVSLNVLHGRLINKIDVLSANQYCVIDEQLAQETYKRKNIVGKKIKLLIRDCYEEFEVIGVVETGGNVLQNLMGGYVPYFVYLPYTAMQKLSGKSDFDEIMIKLRDGADAQTAASKLTASLENSTGVKGSFKVENLVTQKENLNNILGIITFVLAAIAAISLIVAGLSIMTVMLVSVHERTREIGIMKSLGASNRVIMLEFLMETMLLSLLGSLAGIALGLLTAFAGCMIVNYPFLVDFGMLCFCVVFAVVLGVSFGVYPAMKAAKLRPVDALRYE